MKSYQIHLIRHGMTEANQKGQYIGSTDIPLSQEGISQLQELSQNYRYPGAAVFYTSPLKRCVQTCNILYPEITPIAVPGLAECDFGQWEGKTAKELEKDERFHAWLEEGQQSTRQEGKAGRILPIACALPLGNW